MKRKFIGSVTSIEYFFHNGVEVIYLVETKYFSWIKVKEVEQPLVSKVDTPFGKYKLIH